MHKKFWGIVSDFSKYLLTAHAQYINLFGISMLYIKCSMQRTVTYILFGFLEISRFYLAEIVSLIYFYMSIKKRKQAKSGAGSFLHRGLHITLGQTKRAKYLEK